jgi:hypothetical protein
MAFKLKNKNGGAVWTDKQNVALDVGDGAPVAGVLAKTNGGPGGFYQTTIKLDNMAQAVVNGTEYQGTKIYDFPAGRVYIIGAVATLQQKTTSAIASTLNSTTGAIGVGTATASATTLATTMQDIIPTTAFTSSTVINTAGTAVTAVLASPAVFDGTATAKDLFLNTAYATTGDVDADATQTISGTIVVTWVNLGDI